MSAKATSSVKQLELKLTHRVSHPPKKVMKCSFLPSCAYLSYNGQYILYSGMNKLQTYHVILILQGSKE